MTVIRGVYDMKQTKSLYISLILLSIALGSLTTATTTQTEQSNSYILTLQVPSYITDTAGIKGYYKGYQIDLTEQWALLPECGNPLTFSLLLTDNVSIKGKGNTIRYLERMDELPFKWYDLTLKFENIATGTTYSWNVEERDRTNAPSRIPDTTIIILINPDFISSLSASEAQTMVNSSSNICMPTILFKEDIAPAEFKDSLVQTIMGTLNLDAIHTKDRPACQRCLDTTVLSIAHTS